MAHYNINQVVSNYKGKPIKDEDGEKQTYRDAILGVLTYVDEDDAKNADVKRKIFKLSSIVATTGARLSLTPKQVAFILERAEKGAMPLLLGRLEEFFDSKEDVDFGDDKEDAEEKAAE